MKLSLLAALGGFAAYASAAPTQGPYVVVGTPISLSLNEKRLAVVAQRS